MVLTTQTLVPDGADALPLPGIISEQVVGYVWLVKLYHQVIVRETVILS